MTRYTAQWAVFLLITTMTGALHAETLQAGQEYAAGTKIEVPGVNIAFTLPASTSGGIAPGSEFFMLGSTSGEVGRVFVWAAPQSIEQMVQIMSAVITIDVGVRLTPTTTPKVSGRTITADYDATDGTVQYQAHVKTTLGKTGTAVAVITVAPPAAFAKFKALGEKVTASVKFVAPKTPPAAKGGSTGSGQLARSLRNMQLIRFAHGSGYSEKETYSLCGNGRFYHHFDASSTSVNGGAGMNDDDKGRWAANGNQVTLTTDSGNTFTVTLTEQGGSLYIDGTKWYRKANPCQ